MNDQSKVSLNLEAKPYIPKTFHFVSTNQMTPLQLPNNKPFIPLSFNISGSKFQHTGLSLAGSKPFIPKTKLKEMQAPPPVKTYLEYFIDDRDTKQSYNFDYDYMISFEKWEICQETKLLSEQFLLHLDNFKNVISEEVKTNIQNKQGQRKKNYKQSNCKLNDKKDETDLSVFGRKDISKELALAEEFRKKIDEEAEKDPIRFKITEHLNILTVDNYSTTADNIYEIIKDDINKQEIFLDVLFNKSVNEKPYVKLYAKLCKEFDKKLPQKVEKKEEKDKNAPAKKPTSVMRAKLLDKCRQIFKIENNEKFDEYIKVQDPDEREIKLKKFVLGNVNFIGELINIQILSKKILKQCLDNLFLRYNNTSTDKSLKMINLEAIVILLDNFGTLLKIKKEKMKEADKKTFNELVNGYLKKLGEIIEKEKNIVAYVKYKIINLIERSKNNWEKSRYEKSLEAKGKKDLEDENENQEIETNLQTLTQDEINEKMGRDLINFKDHILEEEGTPENYNWLTVDKIYQEHGNSVAQIIQGFLFSCLDFVEDKKRLDLAKKYFNELIFYYKKNLSFKEKQEIVEKTVHLLKTARDLSLDNDLIKDVWGIILSNLIRAHLFNREDLIELNNLEKDDLKAIFIIIAKIIKEDKDAKIHYEKCKFVQQNKSLYEEAMKEINNKS